jgi:hypothetical protein
MPSFVRSAISRCPAKCAIAPNTWKIKTKKDERCIITVQPTSGG